jgi:hypothetical protein
MRWNTPLRRHLPQRSYSMKEALAFAGQRLLLG